MFEGVSRAYEMLFLSVMKEGSIYGYELAAHFEKIAGGHLKVSYGTLYPFLRRMEKKGLITSRRDEASGRVYYKLTAKGRVALEKLPSELEKSQEYFNEKLLGALAIYSGLFGRKALEKVLKRLQ